MLRWKLLLIVFLGLISAWTTSDITMEVCPSGNNNALLNNWSQWDGTRTFISGTQNLSDEAINPSTGAVRTFCPCNSLIDNWKVSFSKMAILSSALYCHKIRLFPFIRLVFRGHCYNGKSRCSAATGARWLSFCYGLTPNNLHGNAAYLSMKDNQEKNHHHHSHHRQRRISTKTLPFDLLVVLCYERFWNYLSRCRCSLVTVLNRYFALWARGETKT